MQFRFVSQTFFQHHDQGKDQDQYFTLKFNSMKL